eukprot:Rmarinus@m.23502
MGIFTKRKLKPHEVLEEKLAENPVFPFSAIEQDCFELEVILLRFYLAVAALLLCLVLLGVFAWAGMLNSAWFVYALCGLVLSIFSAWAYKDKRVYEIDLVKQEYVFAHGSKRLHTGPLHDVYIRTLRRFDAGRNYHYLVFGGHRLESIPLTAPTQQLSELRRVGQKLAGNLTINYFDVSNISDHHVVRHKPEEGGKFQPRRTQV